MRGKNILWITLIAMLLSVGMMNFGSASYPTTVFSVEPDSVSGLVPGDRFWIAVNLENARNVRSCEFKLRFHPGVSVIAALDPVIDGGMFGGYFNRLWFSNIFLLDGIVHVGLTKIDGVPVEGTGTLAHIEFVVLDAGESILELEDTALIDFNGDLCSHHTRDGYYSGPSVDLVRVQATRRDMLVGETVSFNSKVKNTGDVPLYVRVRYDMVKDDEIPLQLGAGQYFFGLGPPNVEYFYVNSYSPWIERDWINPGASLFGPPDGNYMSGPGAWDGSTGFPISSFYGFEDVTLGPGELISNVRLEMYTQYVSGPDGDLDLDCYNGHLDWLGSEWGSFDWDYHTPRWIGEDLSDTDPSVLTEAGFNDFELLIMYWTGDHLPHGEARVDAVRLRLEYSMVAPVDMPVYVVEPNDVLDLDPVIWPLTSYDVGRYYVTATCWYSWGGIIWNRNPKTTTFTWWVTE